MWAIMCISFRAGHTDLATDKWDSRNRCQSRDERLGILVVASFYYIIFSRMHIILQWQGSGMSMNFIEPPWFWRSLLLDVQISFCIGKKGRISWIWTAEVSIFCIICFSVVMWIIAFHLTAKNHNWSKSLLTTGSFLRSGQEVSSASGCLSIPLYKLFNSKYSLYSSALHEKQIGTGRSGMISEAHTVPISLGSHFGLWRE